MSKILVGVLALSAAAGVATAQPYYARGPFNGWPGTGGVTMNFISGVQYQGTITGLTPGVATDFKVANDGWGINGPTANARAVANAAGEVVVNFFDSTSWSDGWLPSTTRRVGYVDSGLHGWDVMGDFNGWSTPVAMSSLGGGLYEATVPAVPGTFDFKFRKAGDWDVSAGWDFSNYGNNASMTINPGDTGVHLYLDLPNGRWQMTSVPTPGALALLGLGGLAAARRRR